MNLIKFLNKFPNEQACIDHLRNLKERSVIVCNRCGGINHYWLQNKLMHECKDCKRRVSLRSGTCLIHTKLPFQYWYMTLFLMTATKKGFSALEMRRQLGHKRYEPIFEMMHKIRAAMGKRDDQYLLNDMIELDDADVETCTEWIEKENLKRGKGSQRQTKVTVMAEAALLEDVEDGVLTKPCWYFKMKVNPGEKAEDMERVVQASIAPNAVLFSDNSKAYVTLHKFVEKHLTENAKNGVTQTLKWVHIAISNLKRNLLGIHHSINEGYLQHYLDEFCYKLNRRFFGERLFDRGIIALMNL
jgi:hypothetical protein